MKDSIHQTDLPINHFDSNRLHHVEILLSEMKEMLSVGSSHRPNPYMTTVEAADYCRVAVQTIYNNRKHIERMPGVRKLLFTAEALDRWLEMRPKRRKR
jgi:hypothetical protein